ncbi:MAG: FprA family A-type flavoprotein [Lachnospiraceae bacterium]|nr:FprA family A-type flavoprotein [Lachnospiraceae bacterium]
MTISQNIQYIGVHDQNIDLFEGQYSVPEGITYNSYVILDEKIAVMDTADKHFTDQWLDQLSQVLGDRTPDYLVIQHMEPDHSCGITALLEKYPETIIVSSQFAFNIMKNTLGTDFAQRRLVVGENSTLELGKHTLTFVTAPMVHWPEVIMTYDSLEKTLFSADAFGTFGMPDTLEDWTPEARRYYIGIVGKYGAQVQALLKKAAALDIQRICALHGPILTGDPTPYIHLYDTWSSYGTESEGILIAYTSIYGSTKAAVELLAEQLRSAGCNVEVRDLARCDMTEAVAQAFRFGKVVLATTTYNADIFPFMKEFIHHLTERNFSNRTVALIENGTWAPAAARVMTKMLADCKNLTYTTASVKLPGALNDTAKAQIAALAQELCAAGASAE